MTDLDKMQAQHAEWQERNFPSSTLEQVVLGVAEETGELAHAVLKRGTGIRRSEDHDAKIRDAVGDIVIFLFGVCTREGVKLSDCLEAAFDEVMRREFRSEL